MTKTAPGSTRAAAIAETVFVTFNYGEREQRLTTPSSATAEHGAHLDGGGKAAAGCSQRDSWSSSLQRMVRRLWFNHHE